MFGMLNQNVQWLKTGSDPEILWKKIGQSPWSNHSRLVFRAMASAPSASAAVLPEGEMEVGYDPADPADEEWQAVQAEQEAQEFADAQADFLSNSLKERDKDSLDEKMRVQMEDLQKTIGRLQLGAEATEKAEAWTRAWMDFQLDPGNHAFFSKLVMFPGRASLTNYLVNMLLGTDEAELTELFSKVHGRAIEWPCGRPHLGGLHPHEEHVWPGGGVGAQLLGWAEVVIIFYHTYDLLISSYISDKCWL